MPAFLRVSEPGVIFAAWLVVGIRQRGLGVSSTGPFYLGPHADTMPPDLRSTNALRSLTRTAVQRGPIFTNGGKSGSFFAQSQNVDKDIPRVFAASFGRFSSYSICFTLCCSKKVKQVSGDIQSAWEPIIYKNLFSKIKVACPSVFFVAFFCGATHHLCGQALYLACRLDLLFSRLIHAIGGTLIL